MDATDQAALVAKGEVTPAELLDAALERIDRLDPDLHALTFRWFDDARAVAAGPDLPAGPFRGVPFLLKDLHAHMAGRPLSNGNAALAAEAPPSPRSTTLVERFEAAGLVIAGRTNSPELGSLPTTEPVAWGPTRNPWDPTRTPGGSSGGAGAAVASGMVPVAHASDGGGSIRIPASCCGLFGLKPTRARNPMGPDAGEGWGGASVGHAVTRSVRDSAALLDVTAGPDVGDPYWAPPPAGPFLDEVGRPPGRLRIALATASWNGASVDPECAAAATAAARLCESLGHHVEEARPDFDRDALAQATRLIIGANVRAALEAGARARGRPLEAGDVERVTWEFAAVGGAHTAADYARSIGVVHRTGRAVGRFFTRHDIILSPTMCQPPFPLGVLDMSSADTDAYLAAVLASIGFTALFNSSGNPAMSVPLAWSRGGLPLGVQFAAPFGGEALLFRLGGQLEAARPWAARRPANLAT